MRSATVIYLAFFVCVSFAFIAQSFAWYVPDVGPSGCVGNCPDEDDGWSEDDDSDDDGYSYQPYYPDSQPSDSGDDDDDYYDQPYYRQPERRDPAVEAFGEGVDLANEGRYAEAEAAYRRAISMKSCYGKAYNNLGTVLLQLGRDDEAIDAFRDAVECGGSRHAKGNLESTLKQRELQRNYEQAKANNDRATQLLKEKRYDEAYTLLKENTYIYPCASTHVNFGNVFYEVGDYEAAIAQFRKALTFDSRDKNARANLKIVQELLRDKRKANKVIEKIPRILDDLSGQVSSLPKRGSDMGFMPMEQALFTKGSKGSSPVDLRGLDAGEPEVVEPQAVAVETAGKGGSLKVRKVPSPEGYMSEDERRERRERMKVLTDKTLDDKLKSTAKALEKMRDGFLDDAEAINEWLGEAQDAEEKALIESFKLLAQAALKLKKFDVGKLKNLQNLCQKGLKAIDYAEAGQKLIKNPADRQAHLEASHLYLKEVHGILKEYQDAYFDEAAIPERTEGFMKNADALDVTGLATFIVSYSYEASRWAVARKRISIIIEGFDDPKGKSKAQEVLSKYYEDLVEEKKRRGGESEDGL